MVKVEVRGMAGAMGKSMGGNILKLKKHNENKEIEFELNYLKSLTTKQRFQMMFKKTEEIRDLLKNHGYRKTSQIIKRA
ncbi:hypothetical protein KAW55_00630 [bacterium]|nr:hypothetical protein [bacterium]